GTTPSRLPSSCARAACAPASSCPCRTSACWRPEMAQRLVTVVVPVFNEEANVRPAYDAVAAVFEGLKDRYRLELLFADNHSGDRTFAEIARLAAEDSRVRAIRYTRNFGFQRSLLTA